MMVLKLLVTVLFSIFIASCGNVNTEQRIENSKVRTTDEEATIEPDKLRNGLKIQKLSVVRGLLMNAPIKEIKRVLGEPDEVYKSPPINSQPYEMNLYWFAVIDDIDDEVVHLCVYVDYNNNSIFKIKACKPGEIMQITQFQKIQTPIE